MEKKLPLCFQGPKGKLEIDASDKELIRLSQLIEVECHGKSVKQAAEDLGISPRQFHRIRNNYKTHGLSGLRDAKRGPKTKSVASGVLIKQVIRYKFLDPSSSAGVIAQKLRQTGFEVSNRTVSRIIHEQGLTKKTLLIKSPEAARTQTTSAHSPD